jgi:hypothetical protein
MRCFIFVKEIHKDNIIADLVVKRLKSYFFTKHKIYLSCYASAVPAGAIKLSYDGSSPFAPELPAQQFYFYKTYDKMPPWAGEY